MKVVKLGIVVGIFIASASAWSDGAVGNGGDGCVAEFKATMNRLGMTVATHPFIRPKLSAAQFQEFFQKLKNCSSPYK